MEVLMSKTPDRDIENKEVINEINKETQKRLKGISFINQVWWIDLVIGILGIVIIVIASKQLKTANKFPNTKGELRTLWAILHPIGAILAIRIFVAIKKLIDIIKNNYDN